MLEIFSKAIYRGIEVPELSEMKPEVLDEMSASLDALIPGRWTLEFPEGSHLADKQPEPRLIIDLPWGGIPAFRGDFIVVDENNTVGVLPYMHFRSQRLKRHKVADLTKEKTDD